MVLVLTVIVLQSISFANYALTTKTTNIIYGSAPYLTFDGGRTRVTNTEALLGISLSDGRTFTPTTNNSSFDNPIILPVVGQSFNDIGMLVPRNTDSIALSSLIGAPYNYWGDDDGDGQGIDGITATGSLNLSIVDNRYHPVARNEVLTICKAPYVLFLSNGEGTLTTRYGVPNESRFTHSFVQYYISPKVLSPEICFAHPSNYSHGADELSDWLDNLGFFTQSVTPSSYGLNFPTTGAHNLFFDLRIAGTNQDLSWAPQDLSWAPVSHGGITATMTRGVNNTPDSPVFYKVRVTLTGPTVTDRNQWHTDNPDRIGRPSLPQVFELVGRDSRGNAVVKYGFELKQWFVLQRYPRSRSYISSWCNKIGGYRLSKVRDLTNASCQGSGSERCGDYANEIVGATPSSSNNRLARHIGAGFFTEWGSMDYLDTDFVRTDRFITSDQTSDNRYQGYVGRQGGFISLTEPDGSYHEYWAFEALCVYP
ncbi:hypothetical protein B6C98_11155 [Gilliamella apis]|nr:hypothetical protein [Gilliamella apis]OTQ57831.1 hypothetical protein B6C98_11155 [Gilliamella apis]OTQ65013.1 hypothetical protein B6C89_10225 [Gilliamella apis]